MTPAEGNQQQALLALYHETWAEIARLRDAEWRITYYFVTVAAALVVFFLNDKVKPMVSICWMAAILTVVQVLILCLGVFHLHRTHRYLTQQRNIRRQIEEALHYYDPGAYASHALLPSEWKGVTINHSFQWAELVFPLMATIVLSYGLALYVMWAISR